MENVKVLYNLFQVDTMNWSCCSAVNRWIYLDLAWSYHPQKFFKHEHPPPRPDANDDGGLHFRESVFMMWATRTGRAGAGMGRWARHDTHQSSHISHRWRLLPQKVSQKMSQRLLLFFRWMAGQKLAQTHLSMWIAQKLSHKKMSSGTHFYTTRVFLNLN